MPRIVNAYADNSAIGDSLAKLGESIYGDQAQKEVFRQKAFGLKRENDNAEPLAAAVRAGNRNDIGYYGKWINELIPQGDAFANPATEAAKIPTIVNALAGDHEQIRQLAIDPNTLPAERVKLVQQLHTIENTIRMYTDPAPSTSSAASSAQGGTPQASTKMAINPQTGQKVGLVNGQWVPTSESRSAASTPPMAGAQQAPDGNWHVKQGGQYFRVEQQDVPLATPPQSGTKSGSDPLSQARDAISRGADPNAVKQRLQQNGINPAALTKPQTVIQNGHTYNLQPDGNYQ